MKFFIEFNHYFCGWPLALSEELKARIPDVSFCGVSWQHDGVYERALAHSDPPIRPLDPLDELERKWLEKPFDPGRMAELEAILGPGTVNRLIIADKNISHGFINGARVRVTGSLKKATKDHDVLRRYVLGLLDYAFTRLEELKPDMVLVGFVDNGIPFALSLACQHLGIPFAQTMLARVGQRFVIDDSREARLNPVRRRFKEALADPQSLAHRIPEAREYLREFRQCQTPGETLLLAGEARDPFAHEPSRTLLQKGIRAGVRVIRETISSRPHILRQAATWQYCLDFLSVRLRTELIRRNGTFIPTGSHLPEPFVFYPLHVDPELATTIMAPMHTDQLAVVKALAMSLPMEMSLVVKEHDPMLGIRPRGFYEQIKRIPRVILVSPEENSIELIRNAKLVCVITGTAGWEAIRLRKPVLVIGEPPYLTLGEGFLHCSDLSKLPAAMHEAFQMLPVREERLELFVASILEESFPCTYSIRETRQLVEPSRQPREIISDLCDHVLRAYDVLRVEIQQSQRPIDNLRGEREALFHQGRSSY